MQYAMFAQLANGIGGYRFYGTNKDTYLVENDIYHILHGFYREYLGDENKANHTIEKARDDMILFYNKCKRRRVFVKIHIIDNNISWDFYTEGQMFNEYWKDSLRRNWEEQKYIKDMPAQMYKAITTRFYISKVIIPINIHENIYDYDIDFHCTRNEAINACNLYWNRKKYVNEISNKNGIIYKKKTEIHNKKMIKREGL